jgi:1-phosphatidylinositol-4-phosphate 5-kinase
MTSAELSTFQRIQKDYIKHLKENPSTLLVKIFGVFSVKLRGVGSVHVMVMENTLQLKTPLNLSFTFDLKGSKVGRIEKNVTEP